MDENYVKNLQSVIDTTHFHSLHLNLLINDIFKFVHAVVTKLENYQQTFITQSTQILKNFYSYLESGIGSYAGAMTKNELYELFSKSALGMLNYKHIRKCCNMFWCFIKIILTELLYYFVCVDALGFYTPELEFELFKNNLNNGTDKIVLFFLDLEYGIDLNLLKLFIEYGIHATLDKYNANCKIINSKLLYNHIIRLTYFNCRSKTEDGRDSTKCGYNKEIINSACDMLSNFLSEEEQTQKLTDEIYPWTGHSISGIKESSHYFKFCNDNNLYNVSWMSGTTFELVMYMFVFFKFDEIKIKSLIILFLNFHILRGTHSVFEVVLGIYEVCKFLKSNKIEQYIILENILLSHIVTIDNQKYLVFDKFYFCETLLNGKILYDNILFWNLDQANL